MKHVVAIMLAFIAFGVNADQRFETVGGFCHFVINPNNDDNEVFFANCLNSIVQNDDGTGTGSTIIKVFYPGNAAPVVTTLELTGDSTGIPCVMVDSNGTVYQTNDWDSIYEFTAGKPGARHGNRHRANDSVTYSLFCRNGQQQ